MSKIIKFPAPTAAEPVARPAVVDTKGRAATSESSILAKGVWGVTVLCWPLISWVLSLDCVFQGLRALWYWHTPGVYAGWKFILHFTVLTALTYYVSCYRPK